MFNQDTPAARNQQLEENRESDAFQKLLDKTGRQLAEQEEEQMEVEGMDMLNALPGGLDNFSM